MQVIDALQALGIRADRGYPGKGMPYPDTPVVAVTLQEQTADCLVLAITVYCTAEFSGTVCEDLSMDIADIVEGLGAGCTVENCGFSGKSGLFSLRILARWDTTPAQEPAFTVQAGDKMLPFATEVTARWDLAYSLKEGNLTTQDNGWFITVTELLPLANAPELDSDYSFTLVISRKGGVESYTGCRWREILYQPTQSGLLRRRVARCWGDRAIAVG